MWPIFDSAQSRDFRKVSLLNSRAGVCVVLRGLKTVVFQVVQGIISELESQGALPRSNSRVSSLATCCGPRFAFEAE